MANGLSFKEYLKSKNLQLQDMTAEQIAAATNEYLKEPNSNGITSVTSLLTFFSKSLKDKNIVINALSMISDPNKGIVVDANSSEFLKQLSELIRMSNDVAKEKEALAYSRSSFNEYSRQANQSLDARVQDLDARQKLLEQKQNELNEQIRKYNEEFKIYSGYVEEYQKAQQQLDEDKKKFDEDKKKLEAAKNDVNADNLKLDEERKKLEIREQEIQAKQADLDKKQQELNDLQNSLNSIQNNSSLQQPTNVTKITKAKNRWKGAAITSILAAAIATAGGVANGIHDESEIKGLKSQLSDANAQLAQYIIELEEENGKVGKFTYEFDENGQLVVKIDDSVIQTPAIPIDYAPFEDFFNGFVDKGALSEDVVNAIFNEDGTINEEKLIEVSPTIYSYYTDMVEYEATLDAIGTNLNGILTSVGVTEKAEDGTAKTNEDGSYVYATVDTYTVDPDNNPETDNSYVDYVTMSNDVYGTINETITAYDEMLTYVSNINGGDIVTFNTENLNNIKTLTGLASSLKTEVEKLGNAYNSVLTDRVDLDEWLSDESNFENEKIQDYINENYLDKDYVNENYTPNEDIDDEYISKDDVNNNYVPKEDYDAVVKENEELEKENEELEKENQGYKDSANSGIESGTTGESDGVESGETPAKPSGDTDKEENKEESQGPNSSNNQSGSNGQGGSFEIGG